MTNKNHIPVPVKAAAKIAMKYRKCVVIIASIDPVSKLLHLTTYGITDGQKILAAEMGEITAKALSADLTKKETYEDLPKEVKNESEK